MNIVQKEAQERRREVIEEGNDNSGRNDGDKALPMGLSDGEHERGLLNLFDRFWVGRPSYGTDLVVVSLCLPVPDRRKTSVSNLGLVLLWQLIDNIRGKKHFLLGGQ